MENLLFLGHSKIFAALRLTRKPVQVEIAKYRLFLLDKSNFLWPILMTVLFLTISIIFATDTATATELTALEKIEKRLEILEATKKPKMLRPNKEVEFLFDSVIGDSYSPTGIDGDFKYKGYPITKIETYSPYVFFIPYTLFKRVKKKTKVYYKKKQVYTLPEINNDLIAAALNKETNEKKVKHIVAKVKEALLAFYEKSQAEKICKSFEDKLLSLLIDSEETQKELKTETAQKYFKRAVIENEKEEEKVLSDSESMKYKMLAVEKVLRLEPTPNCNKPDYKIIERIERAHMEIKNYEWAHDYLRFGILVNYIPDIEANVTSLVISAYPTYRRFMPGTMDFYRRISFFFGAGTANTPGKIETKSIVYSSGLGLDIVKGVSIKIGGSIYTYRELGIEDYKVDYNWSYGICLSSELWKGLFGK